LVGFFTTNPFSDVFSHRIMAIELEAFPLYYRYEKFPDLNEREAFIAGW